MCVGHLSDAGFASPVLDPAVEAAKKKKELMDKEIEKVKQEYEEKQRLKKAKKKSKDDEKGKTKDDDDSGKAEKERDEQVKFLTPVVLITNSLLKESPDKSHRSQSGSQCGSR